MKEERKERTCGRLRSVIWVTMLSMFRRSDRSVYTYYFIPMSSS